jgi:hypothetical protein
MTNAHVSGTRKLRNIHRAKSRTSDVNSHPGPHRMLDIIF